MQFARLATTMHGRQTSDSGPSGKQRVTRNPNVRFEARSSNPSSFNTVAFQCHTPPPKRDAGATGAPALPGLSALPSPRHLWTDLHHAFSAPPTTSTSPSPAMADQQPTFRPRDTLSNTASTTLQTTVVGTLIAGVQNTLRKQNVGAMGIITRSGGIIALYGGWADCTCLELHKAN